MKDKDTEESFDEELDESFSEEEESDFEEEEDEFELVDEEKQAKDPAPVAHKEKTIPPEVHEEERPVHRERTPLPERKLEKVTKETLEFPVCVEVAEISMNAKELIDLSVGNFIDLNIPLTTAVTLLIHGKAIGKGELVQIGEKIGVRVTEIGI